MILHSILDERQIGKTRLMNEGNAIAPIECLAPVALVRASAKTAAMKNARIVNMIFKVIVPAFFISPPFFRKSHQTHSKISGSFWVYDTLFLS